MHSLRLLNILKSFRGNLSNALSTVSETQRKPKHQVNVFSENKFVVINGTVDAFGIAEKVDCKYPAIWLRDNCQCDKCFHVGSHSRTVDWSSFDVNVKPQNVWVSRHNPIQCHKRFSEEKHSEFKPKI